MHVGTPPLVPGSPPWFKSRGPQVPGAVSSPKLRGIRPPVTIVPHLDPFLLVLVTLPSTMHPCTCHHIRT